MTTRSFVKRLTALLKYKQALRDMNRYPDATAEELGREDTCIICREEMRPWDPNAGQLERHRPKKLPCGHILHFGCLRSWLERQQVCPTCRSSVVAEQQPRNPNYRHRMAFHIAPNVANGQNQAGGANGPAPGVQDAQLNGQAGQAGQNPAARAAMRYINLGPIRLGFAQGGQEVADLANRMGVDLNDGNIPVVPQANVPMANPADLSTMDAVRNRLLEVDQRIHQEVRDIQQGMQNVQSAQQELQLINSMLNEVARLRQFQNQAQQQQQPPAQNGQPGQQPPPTPAGGVAPPMLPTPMFPQFPFLPPGQLPLPVFPSAPHPFIPRMNSPAITRHGAPVNTTSIPSGSPELPEGVVIPPGWSLLPLQRLDQAAAVTGTPMPGGPGVQVNIQGPGHHAGDAQSQPSGSTQNATTNTNRGPASSQISTDPEAPQVEVAAPTPLTPNWGGPAQFLGAGNSNNSSLPFGLQAAGSSRSVSETREAGESTERAETDSGGAGEQHTEASGSTYATEENESGSSSKGKAPMATVEDAEDEV